MQLITINPDEVSEERLIEVINSNIKIAKDMATEIERIKGIDNSSFSVEIKSPAKNKSSIAKTSKLSLEDLEFEEKIKRYYHDIMTISPENLQAKLSELFPVVENNKNKSILCRLCAEIMKNIKELRNYIASGELSSEDITELHVEIEKEKKKCEIIRENILSLQIEAIPIEEQQNNLIFVPTVSGNIRVLEEIEHMPPEYHNRFYGLFESIKNSTFKNEQYHRKPSALAGLNMVRDFNTRVAYVRVAKNSYAIISAYIKKADNDKGIQNSLLTKYQHYKAIENKLLANLENDEFIQLNKQYETELFEKLSASEKSPVKSKGVINNGTIN